MDPVVTARVPAGVKKRGVAVLGEIGSSTTELVNAAFDYVIQERKLPRPERSALGEPGIRKLDVAQRADAISFMQAVNLDIPERWRHESFEEIYAQAMEGRYENLR